ncbi:MAG: inositol monophosphatase family protein [Opitutales bacterium]
MPLLHPSDLETLAIITEQAAAKAGKYISECSQREIKVMHKAGGDSLASQVVTEVDGQAQSIVLETLEPTFPKYDLALLTEESEDDGSRLEKDYFWCIDPLDGTLPFTQGKPGYGVSIALIQKDGTPVIGVVYDPTEKTLYRAVRGQGIQMNGSPWNIPKYDPEKKQVLNICFDCSFETDPNREKISTQMQEIAQKSGYTSAHIHIGGGAVLNACYVLQNPPAIYFKPPKPNPGGGSFWDFAATACLFHEAGAHATDFHGESLALNKPGNTFMNEHGVFFCTSARLHSESLNAYGH